MTFCFSPNVLRSLLTNGELPHQYIHALQPGHTNLKTTKDFGSLGIASLTLNKSPILKGAKTIFNDKFL